MGGGKRESSSVLSAVNHISKISGDRLEPVPCDIFANRPNDKKPIECYGMIGIDGDRPLHTSALCTIFVRKTDRLIALMTRVLTS